MSTIKNTLTAFLAENGITCHSVTGNNENPLTTGIPHPIEAASRETLIAPNGGRSVIGFWQEDPALPPPGAERLAGGMRGQMFNQRQ